MNLVQSEDGVQIVEKVNAGSGTTSYTVVSSNSSRSLPGRINAGRDTDARSSVPDEALSATYGSELGGDSNTAFACEHVLFQMMFVNCVIAQQHGEACREMWNAQVRSSPSIHSAPSIRCC